MSKRSQEKEIHLHVFKVYTSKFFIYPKPQVNDSELYIWIFRGRPQNLGATAAVAPADTSLSFRTTK